MASKKSAVVAPKETGIITTHPYKDVSMTFDVSRHLFSVGGPFIQKKFKTLDHRPKSVTGFTKAVDKSFALMSWQERITKEHLLMKLKSKVVITEDIVIEATGLHRVRKQEAATAGTIAHKWAEDFAKGLNPPMPEDEKVKNAVLAFLKWLDEEKFKIKIGEKHLYSKKYDYAGIADAVATRKGKTALIDYKTSSGIYDEMMFQVSAYANALDEMGIKVDERWIVRFDKESGDFFPVPCTNQKADFDAFLGCRAIVLRQEEIKKEKGF